MRSIVRVARGSGALAPRERGAGGTAQAKAPLSEGCGSRGCFRHRWRRPTRTTRSVVRSWIGGRRFTDGCGRWRYVVFDSVKREYLSSMMTKVRQAASVDCPLSSVICSGEEPKWFLADG